VKHFIGVTESTNIATESSLLILRKRETSTVRVRPWLLCEYWNSQYRIHCQQNLQRLIALLHFSVRKSTR